MLQQRKYIIWAFLIFLFVFAGIYFVMKFATEKNAECGTVSDGLLTNSDTSRENKDGKILFLNKCAACHILFRDATGPDLIGFTRRGPWADKGKVLDYLTNPEKFYKENKSAYIENLYHYNQVRHQFFLISQEEVDALIRYLDSSEEKWYNIQR